jgi:hypothetical protein
MNKRAYEGPTVEGMHHMLFGGDGPNHAVEHGSPVHVNKKREVVIASIVEKIDEELANMRTSKDANVQVYCSV